MLDIREILEKIEKNKKRGSKEYYKPLPQDESASIRRYYADHMLIPLDGDPGIKILNQEKTLITTGYDRIVIGDYGAFLEFNDTQAALNNIVSHFFGPPRRKVKYIWMETRDKTRTKIYWQQGRVAYADYKVGKYYVDPYDILYEMV